MNYQTTKQEFEQSARTGSAELAEANERMALALDGTDEGIWDWNVISGEIAFDPNWIRLLGYEAETIDFSFKWLKERMHPDSIPVMEEAFQNYVEGRARYYELEYRIKNKYGKWRWIWSRGKCVDFDNKGQPVRFIGTQQDITDRKNLESKFFQAQKMEAIGRLSGGIAHDFNNLLTSIIGYSELMQDNPSQNDAEEFLKEIVKAGKSAASLTRQLLAFSRNQVFELKIMDLNSEIKELEKMLLRMIGEDIQLKTFLSSSSCRIKADPVQIQQVILNLAINARDAMPHGGKLTIETACLELDELYASEHDLKLNPGSYVMLSISDTGLGMDRETQEKIFEPFFTTKEIGKGTGLGLATVYGIIKQSNGYIWVYSEPGKGTSFKIYMPVILEELAVSQEKQVSSEMLFGSAAILLVEDEQYVRGLLARVLKQYGYTVIEARDGREALALCDQLVDRLDLIITDVVMPGMSGSELVDSLKKKMPDLKILFMSGYSDKAILHHVTINSEVAFIQKPISPKALGRKVQEILK
ncbi:MAG: ATP-binding protein [Desulfosalsimonadaceae bacterium]